MYRKPKAPIRCEISRLNRQNIIKGGGQTELLGWSPRWSRFSVEQYERIQPESFRDRRRMLSPAAKFSCALTNLPSAMIIQARNPGATIVTVKGCIHQDASEAIQ